MTALTRLTLTDFRNHSGTAITPGSGFVVLAGENGAGKTNILEAISLLAPGRGLRRAALSAMARQGGQGGFSISAKLANDVDIGTGTTSFLPERRLVRVNGAASSANALAEWLTVLWLTPTMDRLFLDGAGDRRRFLDRLVLALAPAHAAHSVRYDAAMRARNRLLTEERAADPAWLTGLETQMAEHGTALDAGRRMTVTALSDRLHNVPEGPFARAVLALSGWEGDAARFAHALSQNRLRDAAAGRTLIGPHRQDLDVTHREKAQPAALCSTGEQKALLLGLILAHADLVAERTERRPILLLDEVAAHLDPGRREALFGRLSEAGGQVWLTGTEAALFDAIGSDATRIEVENGALVGA